MTKILCSQLIAYCIYGGMESARAVTIIQAISPRAGMEFYCQYTLDNLHIDVNDMLMSAISSDEPELQGYQILMQFMRDKGLREVEIRRL